MVSSSLSFSFHPPSREASRRTKNTHTHTHTHTHTQSSYQDRVPFPRRVYPSCRFGSRESRPMGRRFHETREGDWCSPVVSPTRLHKSKAHALVLRANLFLLLVLLSFLSFLFFFSFFLFFLSQQLGPTVHGVIKSVDDRREGIKYRSHDARAPSTVIEGRGTRTNERSTCFPFVVSTLFLGSLGDYASH